MTISAFSSLSALGTGKIIRFVHILKLVKIPEIWLNEAEFNETS